MLNGKVKAAGMILVIVMNMLATSPVYAQDEMNPPEPPEVIEEPSKFLDHPIVKLIAEFFENLLSPVTDEAMEGEEPPTLPGSEPEGTAPLVEDPPVLEGEGEPEVVLSPEEMVAQMHEDDQLGFGEIVKLMGILESACPEDAETCDVTYESLLAEYKDGAGMGQLFQKYGKPENLGVGQIRKELDQQEEEDQAMGKANGKGNGKGKKK
jgi:hypothetical protein